MPPTSSRFVVAGLTNGPAFTPNPCLRREVSWIRNHEVYAAAYAVTTYPTARHLARYGVRGPYGRRTLLGRLHNVGYNQARFNIATMRGAGLRSPAVWIDVEHSSLMAWPRTPTRNRAVIEGLMRGYRDAGFRIGVYSTQSVWREILGNVRYGLPEWRTAGPTSMSSALSRCRSGSFQGGPSVMGQWWSPSRDFDVICPGHNRRAVMRTWFHKY